MDKSKKIISTLGSYAGYKSGIIKNPLTLVKSGPCQFWLDGKDVSTFSLNVNKVIQWDDKSGFDRHVSNAINEQRPTYDPVTRRVTFNAALQTYLKSAAFDVPLEQPNTIFILYKITGSIADLEIVFDNISVNNFLFYYQGGFFKLQAGATLNSTETNADDNIHCAEFNTINSDYWVNGINCPLCPTNVGINVLDGITIGAKGDLTTNSDVEICEVFGYNCSITETERIKCENYLYKKHGLTY